MADDDDGHSVTSSLLRSRHQFIECQGVGPNGTYCIPRLKIHQARNESRHILRCEEAGLDISISWNYGPFAFHVDDIDPWLEITLPVRHAVVVKKPSISNACIGETCLFQLIDRLKGVPGQW